MSSNQRYEIKRSKRKTIAIHITPDGRVEVRSPYRVSKVIIDEFVKSKESWIDKHLTAINNRVKTPLTIGGSMLFLGKEYPCLKMMDSHILTAMLCTFKKERIFTML